MKIFKGDEVIAELPDKPRDFDCSIKDGVIKLVTPQGTIALGHFDDACLVKRNLLTAYLGGNDTFNLPDN